MTGVQTCALPIYKKVFPYQLKLLVEELGSITEKDKKELQRICKKIGLKNKGDSGY